MIDMRSDTVTRPTKGMLEAMMKAPVGDDVFNEDPSVIALEQKAADMMGFEAGLFCPSGTMSNQIAIKAHTNPLEEVICHRLSHIYNYEGGGIAFNSAISMRLLEGKRGFIDAQDVLNNINEDDIHKPVTSLVSQENTCNKAGGAVFKAESYKPVFDVCVSKGLKHHLDGARVYNAIVATGDDPKVYGQLFHSVSVCLSKGLGAPVGSVLLGDKAFIKKARRIRKVLGGGMRQAGILAAAGSYALDNNIERLADDHQRAKRLESAVSELGFVSQVYSVDSNLVIFDLNDDVETSVIVDRFKANGILAILMGPKTMRLVTHLDVNDQDIDQVIGTLKTI